MTTDSYPTDVHEPNIESIVATVHQSSTRLTLISEQNKVHLFFLPLNGHQFLTQIIRR